jgi:hypothetical protein
MSASPDVEHEDAPDAAPLRTVPDAPGGPSHRRFVASALATCLAVLGAVLALNTLTDPFALAGVRLVPTAVESDRAIKLTLVERLGSSPGTLILGSSRARQAEPDFLRGLTGQTGFNAAVTGGTAADAFVFTRFAADRFPAAKRRYLWFVDAGIATNGVNPQLRADPRARQYLDGAGRFSLRDVATYVGFQATEASLRVIRKCVLATCTAHIRYRPDGSIPHGPYPPNRTAKVRRTVARLVRAIRANPPVAQPVNPARFVYFERVLAWMKARGERPVIVLNPVHPMVLAELEKHGYPQRKASLEYLEGLRARYDFVLLNLQDIRTWGGAERDFSDATHVNWLNMRRMLRYIAAHDDGALG